MSPVSGSVAVTGAPMLVLAVVFSAMLRAAVVPSLKVGGSLTSVTLIVTVMVLEAPAVSVAVTVTV